MRERFGAAGAGRQCAPRRSSGVVGRPSLTVRGLFGEGEVWVWPRRFVSPPREPFVIAAQLPTRIVGLRRCVSGSIPARRLRWPDLRSASVARSRAVEAVPRSSGAFVSGNSSPSNIARE